MEAPQQNANGALQPLGGSDKALGQIRIPPLPPPFGII